MGRILAVVQRGAVRARREGTFYFFVVACLGVGMGASTAVFTVVDTVLYRSLAFPEAHRLAYLESVVEGPDGEVIRHAVSPANFVEMRDLSETFEKLAATWTEDFDLEEEGDPIRLPGVRATPGLFTTLRVRPVAGRTLIEEDVGRPVALLSESVWRRLFGGDPGVVGTTVELNGLRREVVGIVPAHLAFPSTAEVWVPYRPDDVSPLELHSGGLAVVGRLAEGSSFALASQEMDRVSRFLTELYPANNGGRGTSVRELRAPFVDGTREVLLALLASVLVFLTTAIVNVAGLFAVRSGRQAKTIAVRSALGASRGRISKDAVIEGISVGAISVVAGAIIAHLAVPWLAWSTSGLPPGGVPSVVHPGVALFALVLVSVTAVTCALGPVLVAARVAPGSALRAAGRSSTLSVAQKRVQVAAVVGQVVLGVILVLSAAASVDRVFELRAVDPGFGANRAVSIRVPISDDRFPSFRQRSDVVTRIAESLRSIPGVRAAGGSDVLPVGDGTVFWSLSVEDHPPEDPGGVELADGRLVTPGYMEATGISVVRGRALDTRDRAGSMPVVVVSETFGERYWPGEDPIGRRIKRRAYDSAFPWLTVVGVAADVRDGGPATDVSPTAYFPYAQHDVRLGRQLSFVVRSDRVLDELVPEIRLRVASVDPMAPIVRISTLDELLSESMIAERTSGNVLGGLALGGLALLGIGLYGVMSRAVLERRRELGLRRALGAHASEAVWLVLKTGSVSVMVGTVIGLLAGPTVVRLSGLVLGEALDVPLWSYAAAAALLLTVGAVAGVVPALRAVRVSPIISLRSD